MLAPINAHNYRRIAYESLSSSEKESLTKCWCVAPVRLGKYKIEDQISVISINQDNQWSFKLYNENTILLTNQRLVAVTFSTVGDALIGPIIIIIDQNNEKVIGACLRF